jgi:hypothetical protein
MAETFRELGVRHLEICGAPPSEAVEIMNYIVEGGEKLIPEFHDWDSDSEGSHRSLLEVLARSIDREAYIWLLENKPEAWYKEVLILDEDDHTPM